jgi:C-5 cytosine-specific DNA methylase
MSDNEQPISLNLFNQSGGDETYHTLDTSNNHAVVIPIQDGRGLEQKQNGLGVGGDGDPSYTLTATGGASVAVAFDGYNQRAEVDIHHALRVGRDSGDFVAGLEPVVFEPGAMSRIEGHDPAEIAPTLRAHMGDNQLAVFYGEEATPTGNLTPWPEMGQPNMVYRTDTVTRTVDNNRHLILTQEGQGEAASENNSETGCLTPWPEIQQSDRVYRTDTVTRTVDNNRHNILTTIPLDLRNATRAPDSEQGTGIGSEGDPTPTITVGAVHGVFAETTETKSVYENQRSELREGDVTNSLTSGGGKIGQGYAGVRISSVVRRLTPRECERLQGFPDDHTLIRGDGKEQADTHRYKQMGNAVAVPVVSWIIAGIVEVHG